jgi:protein-disulfide isomerase
MQPVGYPCCPLAPRPNRSLEVLDMRRRRWLSPTVCSFVLPILVLASACKKEAAQTAGASKSGDPCQQYAEQICAQTGVSSPTCASFKTATEIMPPDACKAGIAGLSVTKTKLAQMRKLCDELASKLCKDVDDPTTCQMVQQQTANFPPAQCKTMLAGYANVLGQVKRIAMANKPLPPDKQAKIAAADAASFGPKDAKVTIVEFSDFQCPYCSKAAETVKELKKSYGEKVRFVFRHFPLDFHKQAHGAAQAAMAAHAQGKFWPYHDLLFANQSALQPADLEKYATAAGLNLNAFKSAMKQNTFTKAVDADLELGKDASVQGTPTMFLNGQRVSNPSDFKGLASLIDKELAK